MISHGMTAEMVEHNDWNDEVLSKYEFTIIFTTTWTSLETTSAHKKPAAVQTSAGLVQIKNNAVIVQTNVIFASYNKRIDMWLQ